MQATIHEYNDLCAKHGSDAVSIKSVVKKHQDSCHDILEKVCFYLMPIASIVHVHALNKVINVVTFLGIKCMFWFQSVWCCSRSWP